MPAAIPVIVASSGVRASSRPARSLLAFSLAIGDHFIAAEHDGRSRAEVLELAMRRLLS